MARKKDKRKKAPVTSPEGQEILVLSTNRRARRNYVLEATLEVGLVLLGSEVKSLRLMTPTISEGYARIKREELWLEGINILPLPQASYRNHEPTRARKCLLHKRELRKLIHALDAKGFTLVPLQMYFKGRRVKIELGLGRGRKKGDKRQYEKEKADYREMRQARR